MRLPTLLLVSLLTLPTPAADRATLLKAEQSYAQHRQPRRRGKRRLARPVRPEMDSGRGRRQRAHPRRRRRPPPHGPGTTTVRQQGPPPPRPHRRPRRQPRPPATPPPTFLRPPLP